MSEAWGGHRRRSYATIFLLLLMGCPMQSAVWIEKGSSANHLVFGVSNKRLGKRAIAIGVLRVNACSQPGSGGFPSWIIAGSGGPTTVSRVTYGQAPRGFQTTAGPDSLAAGCYQVS